MAEPMLQLERRVGRLEDALLKMIQEPDCEPEEIERILRGEKTEEAEEDASQEPSAA